MKTQQFVLVLCAIIASPCLADNNQDIRNPSSWIQQFYQQFQNYISQSWGLVLPNQTNPNCNSTIENYSQITDAPEIENVTQERSKVRGHPAARHSHKDLKNNHVHEKTHHQSEKHNRNKHVKHQPEHEKQKLKNKHHN